MGKTGTMSCFSFVIIKGLTCECNGWASSWILLCWAVSQLNVFCLLQVLETMVKNCGDAIHHQVATRDILNDMVKIVKKNVSHLGYIFRYVLLIGISYCFMGILY